MTNPNEVPLLSKSLAKSIMDDDPRRNEGARISEAACDALEAIEDGRAVVVSKADAKRLAAMQRHNDAGAVDVADITRDDELPGMWERSDLIGGETDTKLGADFRDLDEMLVVRHLSPRRPNESLRSAIDRLLNWEAAVSLDPRVSSEAEALVQKGRDESAERLARVDEVMREMRSIASASRPEIDGQLNEWADRLSGKE